MPWTDFKLLLMTLWPIVVSLLIFAAMATRVALVGVGDLVRGLGPRNTDVMVPGAVSLLGLSSRSAAGRGSSSPFQRHGL